LSYDLFLLRQRLSAPLRKIEIVANRRPKSLIDTSLYPSMIITEIRCNAATALAVLTNNPRMRRRPTRVLNIPVKETMLFNAIPETAKDSGR